MQSDKAFLDLGANVGRYSIIVAKNYPRAEVVAVEPDMQVLHNLKKNARYNEVEGRIRVEQKIVDSSNGAKTLYINSENSEKNTVFREEITGVDKYAHGVVADKNLKIEEKTCCVIYWGL